LYKNFNFEFCFYYKLSAHILAVEIFSCWRPWLPPQVFQWHLIRVKTHIQRGGAGRRGAVRPAAFDLIRGNKAVDLFPRIKSHAAGRSTPPRPAPLPPLRSPPLRCMCVFTLSFRHQYSEWQVDLTAWHSSTHPTKPQILNFYLLLYLNFNAINSGRPVTLDMYLQPSDF
jgi:hypothetical protein